MTARRVTKTGRQRWISTWLLAILILQLTGCGNGSGGGSEIALVVGQPDRGFDGRSAAESIGFGLDGAGISAPGPTIRVKAGEPVDVTLENRHHREDGRPYGEPHNFAVLTDADEMFPEPLWGSQTSDIETDESTTISFTPDSPGTYYYVCTFGGHRLRGMVGEFVVEP